MAGEGIKLGLKLELPAVLLGEITTPTLKEETPGTQLHSHPRPLDPMGLRADLSAGPFLRLWRPLVVRVQRRGRPRKERLEQALTKRRG